LSSADKKGFYNRFIYGYGIVRVKRGCIILKYRAVLSPAHLGIHYILAFIERPETGFSTPKMSRESIDFPPPLSPVMPRHSPFLMSKETFRRTGTVLRENNHPLRYVLQIFSTESIYTAPPPA
jgi:hypothetical protein